MSFGSVAHIIALHGHSDVDVFRGGRSGTPAQAGSWTWLALPFVELPRWPGPALPVVTFWLKHACIGRALAECWRRVWAALTHWP